MASNFEKLQTLLSELFQLDQADLDFGIYRIMNQKRDEITRFLEKELLPQVKAAFAQYRSADKKVLEAELQKAIQGAQALGIDPDLVPKVKELREQAANYSVDTLALENEVYSHLYSFFRRYYENGDFISMRRYKEGVYAIPYEGEEVKLHWANADQYYIKTAEYFRDYTFKLPSGRLAHFKIVEAETERDNVKAADEKDRRFMLVGETSVQVVGGELTMRFEYRADAEKRDQKTLNALAVETIRPNTPADWIADLFAPAPTESNPRLTLLEKRLADYTARNTFDYFIHKDLRGFLRRELDFYIKNEVMHLDDVESETSSRVEQYLSKIKALRSIAHKIIEFLTQIEDFQKKLWLKKKFVVETNYCITLDRVPQELYPQIAANDAQREEWVRLFSINEIRGDLLTPSYSVPLTVSFLIANPFLVLDTIFFGDEFKSILLAHIDNIDDQINGVLVHSENFHALNLLQERFRSQIKCIYIDPPYNTDASPIDYKNGYKSSTWMTLMENRLRKSRSYLNQDGVLVAAIDDEQQRELSYLLESGFDGLLLGTICVRSNPSGRPTKTGYSVSHEYLLFAGESRYSNIGRLPPTEKQISRFSESDNQGVFEWRNLRREGSNSDRSARRALYYPIYILDNTIRIPKMIWDEDTEAWIVSEPPVGGEQVVWPDNDDGDQKTWRWEWKTVLASMSELAVRKDRSGKDYVYYKRRPNEEGVVSVSSWFDARYSATEHGTALLKNLFGKSPFTYPKSIYAVEDAIYVAGASNPNSIILDYFAGSGTTAHAIINLNREDKGNRKYILVEMGNYFLNVTKPRIQKVIYSKDWQNGKPILREGISQCFKYLRLESYEDTSNNLGLRRKTEQQLALEQSSAFHESYILSYMLDAESQGSLLNIESFRHPFSYQLNIATGTVGESKPTTIDLVETFNYLVGLRVQTMQAIRGFRVVTGLTPEGERTLIIWRDLAEKDNAALEEFFRKQDYNPRDMEFDLIYVNGDNNLENLRRPDETWKVRLIEEEFLRRMFDTE